MTTDLIHAPWTAAQVTALNAFQHHGRMHPFTCGAEHATGQSPVLVATNGGWVCPDPQCVYRQDWAHAFMAEPAASAGLGVSATPSHTDRGAVSATLWATAEHHTVAEWICCDPINPDHALCAQGGAALRMLQALLVDDPEAWKPAPLLDEVMRLLPPAGSVAESHRLAMSQALDLGTGAPWDAIHERVQDLRRLADEAQQQPADTAEHHTVDGTRYLCHTDDHYCPGQPAASRQEPSVHGESVAHLAGLHDGRDTWADDEDPARIDKLRPEFTDHASIEAIDAQLDRARRQGRRWHIRAEWLISLRQARLVQPAVDARQDGAEL